MKAPAIAEMRPGLDASKVADFPLTVAQAVVDVHAVADARDRRLRRKARSDAQVARRLADDLSYGDRDVGRGERRCRCVRDLELIAAVLGNEHLGLDTGCIQRRDDGGAERIGAPHRCEREGRRMMPGSLERRELHLEGAGHGEARLSLEIRERRFQEGARTAAPRPSVELDDIAHDDVERRIGAVGARAKACLAIRYQAQIALRSERRTLADDIEGRDRRVGGTPAAV